MLVMLLKSTKLQLSPQRKGSVYSCGIRILEAPLPILTLHRRVGDLMKNCLVTT